MKRLCLFPLFGLILLFVHSCSNDFELNAPWKDIPVVYGLLSQDEVQYFRVEKAFLDNSTSALEIAQRPDSLYYENASVSLERLNNDLVLESLSLQRVNGDDEGLPRDPGVFAQAPNYLYKLDLGPNGSLIGGATYRLVLERGDDLASVTAETVLISEMEIVFPSDEADLKWNGINPNQTIQWSFEKEEAIFFDIRMNIRYRESLPNNPTTFVEKSLVWTVKDNLENTLDGEAISYEFDISNFYRFLRNNITASTDINRRLIAVDLIVDAGGQELFEYINVGGANTGITGSQVVPTYSNLSEGFGVFSSKGSTISPNHRLTDDALDSLRNGQFTEDLNFQ